MTNEEFELKLLLLGFISQKKNGTKAIWVNQKEHEEFPNCVIRLEKNNLYVVLFPGNPIKSSRVTTTKEVIDIILPHM